MVEKSFPGRRQLNTVSATEDQLNADLLFEVPDLPAERWLGSVQLLFGGDGQTAGIGHGDEVAEMPKLHPNLPCLVSMGPAYKVFSRQTSALYSNCRGACLTGRTHRSLIRPGRHDGQRLEPYGAYSWVMASK